jgi:hypothetical protein
MTTETIESTALEVVEEPREIVRMDGRTPEATIELAARMATALKDIVEKQRLYAVIQGKKYPQVEAWMTIGRMDNVVAREVIGGIVRHEDGSYEATVELVRLSDGMVTGRGSALCGTERDSPWDKRPEPARRSMAVTRATSRAFRQQYSWIMALAGYEPTPADEMPQDARDVTPRRDERNVVEREIEQERDIARRYPKPGRLQHSADGLIGSVEKGKPPVDMETRQTPDGPAWGFKLAQGRKGFQALAHGALAEKLSLAGIEEGTRVTCWGRVEEVPWEKKQPDGSFKPMPPYLRVHLARVQTPEWTMDGSVDAPTEAESLPVWEPLTDAEKAAIGAGLPG